MHQLSFKPYIIKTRNDKHLISNLLKDDYPVLFEGLHTTFFLSKNLFNNRRIFVRAHNVEHEYYFNLFKNENHFLDKLYFIVESLKLKKYEKVYKSAKVLAISHNDYEYFKNKNYDVYYLPAFNTFDTINAKKGKGKYILYHGNLSVNENTQALHFLIEHVFPNVTVPIVIAGKDPSSEIIGTIKKYKNIKLIINPRNEQIFDLIRNAHINILPTFQPTGIKLKLINALYNGRFCLVNTPMIKNTGLENLCIIKDTGEEMALEIIKLFNKSFEQEELDKRCEILLKLFSNTINAKSLINLLFN